MECEHLRGTMLDAAAGLIPQSPEFERHLRTCVKCSEQFDGFCRTMDLLDEWSVPEPSSRFDSLLHARLLETKTVAAAGWWLRLPVPVVGVSVAALLLVGALALQRTRGAPTPASVVENYDSRALPGSAVGDLQSLEEAGELFADFDLLDELAPDDRATSSRN